MVKPTLVTNSIRSRREEAGITQADLAGRIGVTRQTLIAIEQGKYSPTLELAFQIARAFEVGIDDLFQYPTDQGTEMNATITKTMPAWLNDEYGTASGTRTGDGAHPAARTRRGAAAHPRHRAQRCRRAAHAG